MSGDAKYISLYYSLVHQGASDFYKEIIKGPGGNMSYLPPWAPTSGGGPYPPHMIPPHHSPQSPPQHPPTSTSQSSQSSQNTQNATQPPTSTSVYQNLSPVVKNPTTSAPTTQSSESKPSHVSSPSSASSPITSVSSAAPSAASGTLGPSSSSSSSSSVALGDPYQPQGFQRSESPPLKRPILPDNIKGEGGHGLESPTEMILGIPGPSALDFKARKLSGKYPPPEQLAGPVMYSYQARGRPRKNWTTATGLPTMIPITHPPMHHGSPDDPDDEESKPFKCNLCGKSFKLKGGLIQHERTHSTDRPYVCPDCGKLFRQPTHLQQHLRIHTGEKPYECAFCDKTFRQRTILNQHLRIHTGEKPYACMECGKQFRQKAILDQHFRTHLGDKPYACPHPECRKHFREMATLISHMKCHKDVPDPRIVLQQAKRLVKEERNDELMSGNLNLNREQHGEGNSRELVHELMEQNRGMALDRVGQDRRLSMDNVSQERGGIVQDRVGQERSEHDQRNNRCGGSEQGRYQGNQEQSRQNHHSFPPHNNSEETSTQKSPLTVPQHSSGDQSNERVPPHSQQSHITPNMVPTPQMAMANLIPYPHSIFPATSYMMPPPDPRQYNPHSQAGSSHPRPSQ